MARYFARIVRAVIVSGLGFGGGIGLLVFIGILVSTGKQDAVGIALNFGIVCGIAFGLFCALVLLLSDLTYRLFVSQGSTAVEIWELEQTREIEVKGSIKDARSLSRQALLSVPHIKAVADDDNEFAIRASVGPTWRSPGERMQVHIAHTENGGADSWTVRCTSSCLQDNIAFDYGKNFENVESWIKKMRGLTDDAAKNQLDNGKS